MLQLPVAASLGSASIWRRLAADPDNTWYVEERRIVVAGEPSPTVRHRRLVAQLVAAREAAGLRREQVAALMECSAGKIAHIEQGRSKPSLRDVRDLLRIYQVPADQGEQLLELARQVRGRGWWQDYSDVLSEGLATYFGLEAEASLLRTVHLDLVPGLLQTASYATAIITACAGSWVPADEVARRVQARLTRQHRLTAAQSLGKWAVLDEAALRRTVGDPHIMRAQLQHLIELAKSPTITIQVLPFTSGAHPAMGSPFTILDFADPNDLSVVYVENLMSRLYLDKPEEVNRYQTVFEATRTIALSPEQSTTLLERVAQEWIR